MSAEVKRKYSLEEYLALERGSDVRYEYRDGEVFAMSGGTLWHDVVTANTHESLRDGLRGKPCRVFTGNMQIKTPKALPYRYADGSVACGKLEVERFNGNDLLLNPILLYEALSPSTEAYDRGDKFTIYKSVASLRTLAPSVRSDRIRSSSAGLKCRSAGRPIFFPARRACAMPAFTLSLKSSLSNSATAPRI